MRRNNTKLKLPWSGKIENEYFMIRDSSKRIVCIIPNISETNIKIGNFIIRTSNIKNIKDATLNKIENVAIVFGLVILSLTVITILVDIDYSPMLTLGGGILTTTAYIHLMRIKANNKS